MTQQLQSRRIDAIACETQAAVEKKRAHASAVNALAAGKVPPAQILRWLREQYRRCDRMTQRRAAA